MAGADVVSEHLHLPTLAQRLLVDRCATGFECSQQLRTAGTEGQSCCRKAPA